MTKDKEISSEMEETAPSSKGQKYFQHDGSFYSLLEIGILLDEASRGAAESLPGVAPAAQLLNDRREVPGTAGLVDDAGHFPSGTFGICL